MFIVAVFFSLEKVYTILSRSFRFCVLFFTLLQLKKNRFIAKKPTAVFICVDRFFCHYCSQTIFLPDFERRKFTTIISVMTAPQRHAQTPGDQRKKKRHSTENSISQFCFFLHFVNKDAIKSRKCKKKNNFDWHKMSQETNATGYGRP